MLYHDAFPNEKQTDSTLAKFFIPVFKFAKIPITGCLCLNDGLHTSPKGSSSLVISGKIFLTAQDIASDAEKNKMQTTSILLFALYAMKMLTLFLIDSKYQHA